MRILVMLLMAMAIFGCDRGSDSVFSREMHEIVLAYESTELRLPDDRAIVRLIEKQTTKELKDECRKNFLELLFAISLDRMPLDRQARVINAMLRATAAVVDALPRDDDGWFAAYEIDMRRFDWWKSRILGTKSLHDRVRTDSDFAKALSDADRKALCQICEVGVENYEAQLNDLECLFYVKKKQMGEDAWNAIKAKLERWLGRPLRTREQLKRDCRERRHVVFPLDDADRSLLLDWVEPR